MKATVYRKDDCALVALFNFSEQPEEFRLDVNESLLGFEPKESAEVCWIENIQDASVFELKDSIHLDSKKGIIFRIKKPDIHKREERKSVDFFSSLL